MTKSTGASPQKTNPVLVGVLILVIIIGAVMFFTGQEPQQKSGVTFSKPLSLSNGVLKIKKGDETITVAQESPSGLNRNPFLTPSMYLKDKEDQRQDTRTRVTPILQPTITPPLPDNSGESVKDESKNALRFGAVFQKNNDCLALIYFQGKGYILRANDTVPHSEYRVKQIMTKTVILTKDNGEERELILKGGERKS